MVKHPVVGIGIAVAHHIVVGGFTEHHVLERHIANGSLRPTVSTLLPEEDILGEAGTEDGFRNGYIGDVATIINLNTIGMGAVIRGFIDFGMFASVIEP